MIQFGGHHLAINLTLAGSEATLAPSLTGAQPALLHDSKAARLVRWATRTTRRSL